MMATSCIAFALAMHMLTSTDRSPISVRGRILDSEGAAIKGALILFHADPAADQRQLSRPDVSRDSDEEGLFDLQVEQGFYDVCVMASSFTPECRKVYATTGRNIRYDLKLKMDPLVAQMLADKIKLWH